jgi:hypothetical protein
MNTTTATMSVSEYVDHVADRAASRESEQLFDFFSLGRYVATGEATYDQVRDLAVAAFKVRNLATSTVKVYVSYGYGIAQLFDTFDDVETFADDECNGSRSLKRVYDATRNRDEAGDDDEAGEGEGEGEGDEAGETRPVADVIIALLAQVTDRADLARIAEAVRVAQVNGETGFRTDVAA